MHPTSWDKIKRPKRLMCRDWQKKGIARKRLNETHRRRVDSHKESSTITTVVIVIVVFNMLMYWHYN